jgi:hypothetical protein
VDIAKSQKRLSDEKARAREAQRFLPAVNSGPDWQRMIETETLLSGRKRREQERYDFSLARNQSQNIGNESDATGPAVPDATDEEVKELVLETIKARRRVENPAERLHVAAYAPSSIGDYSRFNHEDVQRPKMRKKAPRALRPKPTAIDGTLIGQRFKAYLAAKGASPGKPGK